METTNLKTFNYLENGEVEFSILDTIKTSNFLDSGFYNLNAIHANMGYQIKLNIYTELECQEIHEFPDKDKLNILFKSFFDKNIIKCVKDLNFIHKSGILFYGKEGTGKTSIIKYYASNFIKKHNAIVFNFTNKGSYLPECWDFIKKIRNIQNNPIVLIIDEIDGLLKYDKSLETTLKAILDGYLSIDNFICFAATNYIEDIPKALKERESRFKYCLNIEGIQEEKFIENLITNILKDIDSNELKETISFLKGKTIDEIKQYCMNKILNIKFYPKGSQLTGFKKN